MADQVEAATVVGPPRTDARAPGSVLGPLLLGLVPFWYQVSLSGFRPERFDQVVHRQNAWLLVLATATALVAGRRFPRRAPLIALATWAVLVGLFGMELGTRMAVVGLGPTAIWAIGLRTIALPSTSRWRRCAATAPVTFPLLLAIAAQLVWALGIKGPVLLLMAATALLVACTWIDALGNRAEALARAVGDPFRRSPDGIRRPAALVGAGARAVGSLPDRAVVLTSRIGRWFSTPSPVRSTNEDVVAPPTDATSDVATSRPSWWRRYRRPLLSWLGFHYVLTKALLVTSIWWNDKDFSRLHPFFDVTDPTGKVGWGTGDYWRIADHGYRLDEYLEAAFPSYALMTRWLSSLWLHDLARSQVFISSVASLLATLLFWRLLEVKGVTGPARTTALALFLLYPYSFMLAGVAYSDPVLMPMVIGAFLLLERDRPVAAGLVAGLATFTRPNALQLIPAMIVFQLIRTGAIRPGVVRADAANRWQRLRSRVVVDPRRLRPRDAGVLLSVLGVGTFAVWMQRHAGDPLYFLSVQSHYGHRPITQVSTWLKTDFMLGPQHFIDHAPEAWNHGLSGAVLVGAILAIPAVVRRLGWGYGTYVIGVVAMTWVAPNGFAPAGRYLLPVLPFYALVGGEALWNRPRILRPLLTACVVLTLVLAVTFAKPEMWLEW